MHGRRGTRSSVTEESLKGAPINEGSPSESDNGASSDAEHNQNSTTAGQQGGQTNTAANGEHPGAENGQRSDSAGDSAHSPNGFNSEESQEWQELQTLRKGKRHADQKITEQGQENAQLRQYNEKLENELGEIKRMLSQRLTQNGAESNGQGTNDLDPYRDESQTGTEMTEDIDQVKRTIGGVYREVTEIGKDVADFKSFREDLQHDKDVSYLQQELGVDREAAETLIDLHGQGDIVSFAKAYELSSLPAEARQTAREAREAQRAAVGQPTSNSNAPYVPTGDETAARQEQAKKLMEMPDGRAKARAVDEAINQDPLMFEFIERELGFNFGRS